MEYIRLNETVKNKGELLTVEECRKELPARIRRNPQTDFYTSLFRFPVEAFNHFKKNKGSISGYTGPAHAPFLFFDFDSENRVQAKADVDTLLSKIKETLSINDIDNNVHIFFSGNKGFHAYLYTEEQYSPEDMKQICSDLADGLESFDSQIYNTTRLVRVKNTVHQKSGLYKIGIQASKFKDLDIPTIEEMSKDSKNSYKGVIEKVSVKHLIRVVETVATDVVNSTSLDGVKGLDIVDFKKVPRDYPRCMYGLLQGIMVPGRGERSRIYLRLAAFLRNQGFDKDQAHNLLKATARKNKQLYPDSELFTKQEIYNTAINSAYLDSEKTYSKGNWGVDPDGDDGQLLKSYCDVIGKVTDRKCCLHQKSKKASVIQIDQVFDSFSNFAKNIDQNRVATGIKFLDDNCKILKGSVNLLVGGSGVGKTSLNLQIMENANKSNINTMFFSMDMHRDMVYLKLAQRFSNFTQDEILNMLKTTEGKKKLNEIREVIKSEYNRTYFDFSSTLTLESMRDKIHHVEETTGNKIGFVVVDYASRISGPFSDIHANANHNALLSRQIADETDAAWLYICQISRQNGSGSTPLRSKRIAKDSSGWEEVAAILIGIWRSYMGMEGRANPEGGEFSDDIIRMCIAKNRMGSEVEEPLWWNGAKGLIKSMTPQQLDEYSQYREKDEALAQKILKGTYGRSSFGE